ncbi:hypothetical protein LOK49_LG05G01819 [Camellia lanceoleosa]|uniref:Uncharacterized protein n=1 Tax=Camellia lanceoleosa TaxID=1840588 RepID=A0ACC0HTN8_9ERIC|nr:hypothetical protein LOK49_LG05G01819 [Camellia lanceoleosa]
MVACAQGMDLYGCWYQLCCGLRTYLLWSLDLLVRIANGCTTYDPMQNMNMNMNMNMTMNMSMYLNLFLIGNLNMHKTLFLIRLCF